MTILSIHGIETRLTRDQFFSWTRTNVYRVVSDDPQEDPRDVVWLASEGDVDEGEELPIPKDPEAKTWTWGSGDTLLVDNSRALVEIDCRLESPLGQRTGNRVVWIVTFTYRDWHFVHEGQKQPDARMIGYHEEDLSRPWHMPVVWGGTLIQQEEEVSLTVEPSDGSNRTAFINSAEQPYPSQRVQKDYGTITFACAVKNLDANHRMQAVNSINTSAFWGFSAGKLKLARWFYDVKYWTDDAGNREGYFTQFQEWHLNEDTWDITKPDYGTVTREAGSGDPDARYQTIDFATTDAGLAWGTNVLLDGSGAFDSDPTSVLSANVNGPFQFYKDKNFQDDPWQQYIPATLGQTEPPQINVT